MIVRAADRGATVTGWLDSRHSFSYGSAYDPANTHFGLLLACNEDRLAAGAGFDPHPHRDVEVVTWVVSGVLRHTDDAGHAGEARPGVVQRMSAGRGVRHAEHAVGGPAHYVQAWVRPATFGGEPAYDTVAVGPDPGPAAGPGSGPPVPALAAVRPLNQPDATLHAGRLPAGAAVTLGPVAYLHVLVVAGTAVVAGTTLGPGDAARLTDRAAAIGTDTGAEVVAWAMRTGLAGQPGTRT